MLFPKVLRVLVTDCTCSRMPVQNVAVFMSLVMPHKNNYDLPPQITGNDGTTTFLRYKIKEEIVRYRNEALMDYQGEIDDVIGIEVSVLESDCIERAIAADELWSAGNVDLKMPERFVRRLRATSNDRYTPARVFRELGASMLQPIELRIRAKV